MRSSIKALIVAGVLAWLWPATCAAGADGAYIVKPGQTLAAIAKEQFQDESRWRDIARLNDLHSPYRITVGQRLNLPSPAAAGSITSPPLSSTHAPDNETKSSTTLKAIGVADLCVIGLGAVLALVGFVWFTCVTFGQGFCWGIGALLIHPIQYVFLAKFWNIAKRSFITQYVGIALFFAGLMGTGLLAALMQGK